MGRACYSLVHVHGRGWLGRKGVGEGAGEGGERRAWIPAPRVVEPGHSSLYLVSFANHLFPDDLQGKDKMIHSHQIPVTFHQTKDQIVS